MSHYRIVMIRKPYPAYISYGGPMATIACYEVESEKYNSPDKAHEEINRRVAGGGWVTNAYGIPEPLDCSEDWFIVIQCF